MNTKIFLALFVALGLISGLIFAQTVVTPVEPPQPSPSLSNQDLTDQYLVQLLTKILQSKTKADDRALINLLIQLLQSRQKNMNFQTQTNVIEKGERTSESEPMPPSGEVRSESAPTLRPKVASLFDEDRSDDSLVQVNNFRIIKVTLNPSPDAKAYLYVVKDVGWNCVFYKSPDGSVSSNCPLDIRKPILQQELVVRINNDTILLLRNRKRTDISQFKVGDKINVYGFLDKDNFTIDALVVRKIVSSPQPPVLKPIVPSPVQPLPTPTPIYKLPLRWFTGYLEKIPLSTITGENSPATSSNQGQPTHHFTSDDNLVYSVRGVDDNARSLLEKYSNQRVRLYAFINLKATTNTLGSLLAKDVVPLITYVTTTPISTNTKRLTVQSISGKLEEAGLSIYMWGSHTLIADDGKTYQVKALGENVREDLNKYTGRKVIIYAKKVYYNNLEGGFWAIEAEKIVPLE